MVKEFLSAGLLVALLMPALASAADCYHADADSGDLKFSGYAEGNRFQGHFREFSVEICLEDHDLASARIEVQVATGSATVGNRQGDQALLDDELLAAEQYPRAFWVSGEIEDEGHRHFAEGELNLRGVSASQPVALMLERHDDQWVLSGEAEILRLEYEVGQGEFADTDFIDAEVMLTFELNLAPVS